MICWTRASRGAAALALLLGLGRAAPALADEDRATTVRRAVELFEEAKRLREARQLAEACRLFEQSNDLDPQTGTLLNLADCEEKIGRRARARERYLQVAERAAAANPDDPRIALARERAERLGAMLAGLSLVPPDIGDVEYAIEIDGDSVPVDRLRGVVWLEPGPHRIVVRAGGRQERGYRLSLAEGQVRTVELDVGPPLGATSIDDAQLVPATQRREAPVLGWALVGAGAGAIGAGMVTGILVLGERSRLEDDCPGGLCNTAGQARLDAVERLAAWTNVLFVVGAASAGAGTYLVLASPGGDAARPSARVGVRGAALVAEGRF
jgi:tetratricopeptide (TPR) repeat protein